MESKFGLGLDVLTSLQHIFVSGSEEHADVARGEFERVGGRDPVQHGRLGRASLLGGVLDLVGVVVSENSKHGHGVVVCGGGRVVVVVVVLNGRHRITGCENRMSIE